MVFAASGNLYVVSRDSDSADWRKTFSYPVCGFFSSQEVPFDSSTCRGVCFFRGLHSGSVWIPNSLLYGRESSKPIDLRIPGLRLLKPTVCPLVY